MSNFKYEKFRGEALLEKLETLLHLPHSERAKECGYYSTVITSNGRSKIELNISEFYDAILAARKEQFLRTVSLTQSNNPQQYQPQEFDAILGGNTPYPMTSAVLGGIKGVRNRLKSTITEIRVTAISEALNYGTPGLDLVIAALQDSSAQVRIYAYELLHNRSDFKTKQALLNFDKMQLFTRLRDWQNDNFNPKLGIINSSKNVYVFKSLEQVESLLQFPQVSQIQVLISQVTSEQLSYSNKFGYIVDILFDIHEYLSGLKAVWIDTNISPTPLGDISAILKTYPHLEFLHIRNGCHLEFSPIRHKNLKTLIVDATDLNKVTFQQIYKLELPALEYLDLGFSNSGNNTLPNATEVAPMFSGNLFPNLKYLGLRGGKNYNKIAAALTNSVLIHRLIGLDISDGNLGDKGAELLLNCPAINSLAILNVSKNRLTKDMVQKLSKLKCQVNAKSQKYYDRYSPAWE
ncbi:MAG: hypothetical protein HWQ41_24075 [Nostoc sp. NOS(2021)]|uniref:hypothetical protein n=1 Tax=Nostoc sp. NOS(2021) TaxID=2815407 RepID=UPI0025FFBB14|nr:hypothetical protein [Nostoc sp. NOS(2021)]MBN3898237.1 hypothetical protein [Nostoc sp. NOS(2021)]